MAGIRNGLLTHMVQSATEFTPSEPQSSVSTLTRELFLSVYTDTGVEIRANVKSF